MAFFPPAPARRGFSSTGAVMLNQANAYVNRRALSLLPPTAPPQTKARRLHHCGNVPPIGMLNHPCVASRRHAFNPCGVRARAV